MYLIRIFFIVVDRVSSTNNQLCSAQVSNTVFSIVIKGMKIRRWTFLWLLHFSLSYSDNKCENKEVFGVLKQAIDKKIRSIIHLHMFIPLIVMLSWEAAKQSDIVVPTYLFQFGHRGRCRSMKCRRWSWCWRWLRRVCPECWSSQYYLTRLISSSHPS